LRHFSLWPVRTAGHYDEEERGTTKLSVIRVAAIRNIISKLYQASAFHLCVVPAFNLGAKYGILVCMRARQRLLFGKTFNHHIKIR
jgi:hypothetical protein